MKKITAYVWASGLIEFGDVVPDGALPVISGEPKTVKNAIEVLARHSRNPSGAIAGSGYPGSTRSAGSPESINQVLS
ncbi:phage host nuclease inhibitor protein [Escherichia coli]|nr:phage host nuclease inhibitor protein [Escherichia coli]